MFASLFAFTLMGLPGLAQTFTSHAIGTVSNAGCSGSGTVMLTGSAGALSDKKLTDNYEFCAMQTSANFTLVGEITAIGTSSTAGLQVRGDLTSGSRNEMIYGVAGTGGTNPGTNRREFEGALNLSTDRPFTIYKEPETSYPGPGLKLWLKLVRYGDEISLYYSPDNGSDAPYEWRTSGSNQTLVGLTTPLYAGLVVTGSGGSATFSHVTYTPITAPPTQPTTTWLGNTFPGSGSFMIYRASALTVDPDGNLLVQGEGEAQSAEMLTASTGAFKTYFSHSHYAAAPGIASSNRFVFSPRWDLVETSLRGPGIQYYNTQGQVSSQSPFGIFYPLDSQGNRANIENVAADPSGTTLFALEYPTNSYNNNVVHRMSTSGVVISDTGGSVAPTEMTGSPFTLAVGTGNLATRLAVDPTGPYLWAIVQVGTAMHVEKFSQTDGSFLNISIPGFKDPEGIAVDSSGNVYVCDHDPSEQRIDVYSSAGSYVRTLGLTGGSYAESSTGAILPTSLDHPEGIWVDTANNLYVASTGPFVTQAFGNTGLQLRMYKPNTPGGFVTSLTASNLVWHNEGLDYTDGGIPDPASPTDVYDKYHHFTVNYANLGSTNNSSFWTYKGQTLDDEHYPSLPATQLGDHRITDGNYEGGGFIRHINSQKFLVIQDANGYRINIYKFGPGEVAVPYARFDRQSGPGNNLEIWNDSDGNGLIGGSNPNCGTSGQSTGEETCISPSPMGDVYQDFYTWYMDVDGNVWSVGQSSANPAPVIYEYLVQGTGNPTWCYAANPPNSCVKTWAVPQAFAYTSGTAETIFPLRLIYDKYEDAMLISGYTNNANVMGYNTRTDESKDHSTMKGVLGVGSGDIGTQILRFNNWSQNSGSKSASLVANCTLTVDAPPTPGAGGDQTLGSGPRTWDYSNGLIGVENDFSNRLTYYYAYDSHCSQTNQSAKVYPQYQQQTGTNNYGFQVGPEVGAVTGTADIAFSMNLIYLNDAANTYVTFVEEGGQHKIVALGYTDGNVPYPAP